MPILVLSARGAEGDKVSALDAGADDYVTKPFGAEELLARIRATLRRVENPSPPSEPIVRGDLVIDRERFRVLRSGEEVRLTPKEFELLTFLAQHPGRVLTHRTILKAIWGPHAGRSAGAPAGARRFASKEDRTESVVARSTSSPSRGSATDSRMTDAWERGEVGRSGLIVPSGILPPGSTASSAQS